MVRILQGYLSHLRFKVLCTTITNKFLLLALKCMMRVKKQKILNLNGVAFSDPVILI